MQDVVSPAQNARQTHRCDGTGTSSRAEAPDNLVGAGSARTVTVRPTVSFSSRAATEALPSVIKGMILFYDTCRTTFRQISRAIGDGRRDEGRRNP